jgi:Ca2+-binding EF-hand superfamily protein
VRTSPHPYALNATPTPTSQINHGNALAIISEIFSQVDKDNNGRLYVDEAEKLLLKLNSRLGRRYTDEDMQKFFQYLNVDKNDGTISLKEFKIAFERVL